MRSFALIGLAVVAIALLQAGREAAGPEGGAVLGRPAPEFPSSAEADWFNSSPLGMTSLRGRVVLLEIWTFG